MGTVASLIRRPRIIMITAVIIDDQIGLAENIFLCILLTFLRLVILEKKNTFINS